MAVPILRAIYEDAECPPKDPELYRSALGIMEADGISPQLHSLLKERGWLEETPDFFRERLLLGCSESMVRSLLLVNQTEAILRALEGEGIEGIPLKGVRFAAKYFGHFSARAASDIDLLIRPRDMEKAIRCVGELGYTEESEAIPGHFHRSFSKHLPQSPVPLTVELHWDLLKSSTSEFHIEPFWSSALPSRGSKYILELDEFHEFYMICLHGWRHNMDSLKYDLDIVQMLHRTRGRLDYGRLLETAKGDRTWKRMVRTLSMVYGRFPHLHRVAPFPQSQPVIQRERGWGKYLDFLDYQIRSYDCMKHSLAEARCWLFPRKSAGE